MSMNTLDRLVSRTLPPTMEAMEGRALLSGAAFDPTFGDGGAAVLSLPGVAADAMNQAYAVATQADGKVLMFGAVGASREKNFVVARYTADGQLDGSFGDGGVVTIDPGDKGWAASVAVQPDGKVLLGGQATGGRKFPGGAAGAYNDSVIYRLNPDGSLDSTFGEDGKITFHFGQYHSYLVEVAVMPNGKIVAGGWGNQKAGDHDFYASRFNADGSPDLKFGKKGIAIADSGAADVATDLQLQADGRILLTGWRGTGNPPDDYPDRKFVAVRFNEGGRLDKSFGGDGIVLTGFDNLATSVTVNTTSDGKIVVAGESYRIENSQAISSVAVVRYNPNGSLDKSFGKGGRAVAPVWGGAVLGTVVEPDGDVLVSATGGDEDSGVLFSLVRFTADGLLDKAYGEGGRSIIEDGPGNAQPYRAMAVQEDGKLLFAGGAPIVGAYDSDLAVGRIDPYGDTGAAAAGKKAKQKRKVVEAKEKKPKKHKAAWEQVGQKKIKKKHVGRGTFVVKFAAGKLIVAEDGRH